MSLPYAAQVLTLPPAPFLTFRRDSPNTKDLSQSFEVRGLYCWRTFMPPHFSPLSPKLSPISAQALTFDRPWSHPNPPDLSHISAHALTFGAIRR
jgi:hypothetical protein